MDYIQYMQNPAQQVLKLDDAANTAAYDRALQYFESLGFRGKTASDLAIEKVHSNMLFDAGSLPEVDVVAQAWGDGDNASRRENYQKARKAKREAEEKEQQHEMNKGIREVTDKWGKGIGLGMTALAALPVASGAIAGISTGVNAFKTAYPLVYNGIKTGLNVGFTIDGVKNTLSDNGVKKTYRIGKDIYQNGLTRQKAWDFTKSAVGDALDIAGGVGLVGDVVRGGKNLHQLVTTGTSASSTLNSIRNKGRKLLDDRFNKTIFPEHMQGIEWYNKEIAPGRVGREFSDIEKSKLFYENVDRFHLTGPDRVPLSAVLTHNGATALDGRIYYNPFIRKSSIAPTAVHEGNHRVQFLEPAFHDVQVTKTVNPSTGSIELIRIDPGSFRKAPLYHYDTGKLIPEANYHPDTGESLHLDFSPSRDLNVGFDRYGKIRITTPEQITQNRTNYFLKIDPKQYNNYYHDHTLRGPIDASRLEAQSKAFPIRRMGELKLGHPASNLAIEKDSSTAEMLYNLSRKHNGIGGEGLDFIVRNSPDREIKQLLNKTNGYTQDYLSNIRVNELFNNGTNHPYDLVRNALLLRKQGGTIHIKKGNRGKFTASAKDAGEEVQEHAHKVMNDPNATPLQKKRANFAIQAKKWNRKHQLGGKINDLDIFV